MALMFVVGVALLNYFLLFSFWAVRRDGQAGMCWPCPCCSLFVLAPASLVFLVMSVGLGPTRTLTLAVGLSVFPSLAILVGLLVWEYRRDERFRRLREQSSEVEAPFVWRSEED